MPRREARIAVDASPEALWRFLRDFRSLCTCIPGVERIEPIDDRSADVTVREKVGVIPMVLTLRAVIESEDPPRRLHAVAKAEHLTMVIDVALEPAGRGTTLVSVFDVTGTGQLKPIVDRLFEKRATERTAQFADCLEKRFAGGASGPQAPEPGKPPELKTSLKEEAPAGRAWTRRLRDWLRRLVRRPAP